MSQAPPTPDRVEDLSASLPVVPRDDAPGATDNPAAISRIVWRLLPFLCLLFIVNYLDRNNVAMAKLTMLGDTGIGEAAYGFGAGMCFFIGYFIFEVPSNLIMERVWARIWMARIMITWGVVSAAMMFVRGPHSFYGLRFILGIAEAGFFPGIVLYLTFWVPSHYRSRVIALFMTSTVISGIIGNPLAGLLMTMEGIGGLHGWQWLYLIEGIAPIVLGIVTLLILPDRPAQVRWLSQSQKDWIDRELAREHRESHHHVAELARALGDARLWLLAVIYFMLIMGQYGFIYWMPTIIKAATHVSDQKVGLLCMIPYSVALVSMLTVAHHVDRKNERRWHIAACAIVSAIGTFLVTRAHTPVAMIGALCFAAVGIWSSLGPFWALATRFLRGTAAAGGIAIVNSIGALAGGVGPTVIGWAKEKTGGFNGLLVVVASLICGAVLVLCVPKKVDRGEVGTT